MEGQTEGATIGSRYIFYLFLQEFRQLIFNIVFYFRQVPLISEGKIVEIVEVCHGVTRMLIELDNSLGRLQMLR